MLDFSPRAKVVAKVLIAAVLVAVVVGVAGRNLAPSMPLATLFFWCMVVLAGFILVSVVWACVNLALGQWTLRHGGTDPQWFWFNAEPPGLKSLRDRQQSTAEQRKK